VDCLLVGHTASAKRMTRVVFESAADIFNRKIRYLVLTDTEQPTRLVTMIVPPFDDDVGPL